APLGLGADAPELALHVAENLLAPALALGAEAGGDALTLGDHACLDLLPHRIDVVDALDAHVDELYAESRHQPGCRGEHLVLELRTALGRTLEVRLGERVDLLLGERGDIDLPIGRAHDLLELGPGDDVAHDRIEDVVEPRAGALL